MQSGGAMKALCTFMGLLVIGAVVAGVYLGDSELFSPSVHAAKADKLAAEAAALRAHTAYEERQRQIALDIAEQKAAAELQALQARRARQLELMEPLAIVGMVVVSIAALTVTLAVSYYFIAKARVAAIRVPERGQSVSYRIVPSASNQERERASQGVRTSSPIDRAKVRSDQVTYDGFLAHFAEYILHPHHVRVFYRTGIAPEVEDIYLTVLTETGIITWQNNGHSGWILAREIRDVEDVWQRISRRTFYSLASSCRTPSAMESLFIRGAQLQQKPVPAFWNS
jgi:hypothetical protein